jgi:hypothetical protein
MRIIDAISRLQFKVYSILPLIVALIRREEAEKDKDNPIFFFWYSKKTFFIFPMYFLDKTEK